MYVNGKPTLGAHATVFHVLLPCGNSTCSFHIYNVWAPLVVLSPSGALTKLCVHILTSWQPPHVTIRGGKMRSGDADWAPFGKSLYNGVIRSAPGGKNGAKERCTHGCDGYAIKLCTFHDWSSTPVNTTMLPSTQPTANILPNWCGPHAAHWPGDGNTEL